MVHASRTFRVFVSSTFSDLKEERNALQREVFPKLRELCAQHGCRFQAIDLRWGVSEEAGLDQQTMKICLEEIERSQKVSPKPNFIVLLGDRYGWRPLPYEIPADEFDEILKNVSANEKELLLWNDEVLENENGWYRKDLNAVPPVYCLQPRTGKYIDYDKWDLVEKKLHSTILEASDKAGLNEHKRAKYSASATEQEIVQGALQVEDAEDHVFCFFRNMDNQNIDKLVLDAKTNPIAREHIDLNNSLNLDTKALNLQNQLKNKLENKLTRTDNKKNVYKYQAEWTGNEVSADNIEKMCDDVYNSLSSVILEEIKEIKKIEDLTNEIKDHEVFGKERAKFFTGRKEILKEINNYLQTNNSSSLAIYGDSGSGKSALMAKAVEIAQKNYPDAEVITRFIGATPSSSNIRYLLESLYRQISRVYGADESKIPAEYQKLADELQIRLTLAANQKPLIIFLDALDQLSDFENARNLAWLPTELPDNVHIIVSTLPGECSDVLKNRLSPDKIIELGTMPTDDGEEVLNLWLDEASRKLPPHQKKEILNKFSRNGLPLYLKLAFEEVKNWKSYTNLEETILSQEIPGIISDLFKRLSSESNHGSVMVSHSLSYIATSRHGLSEDEMIDILSKDKDVLDDFKRRSFHTPPEEKLPVVLWSRLYFDLEPYLKEHGVGEVSLLNFYHHQLKEVVLKEFLTPETKKEFHLKLADYFRLEEADKMPIQLENILLNSLQQQEFFKPVTEKLNSETVENSNLTTSNGFKPRKLDDRKVDELPWQLDKAESWDHLKVTLTNMDMFMELVSEDKKYELMKYWRDIGDRYDMADSYNTSFDRIKRMRIPEKWLFNYYVEVARFLQLNEYYDGAEKLFNKVLDMKRSEEIGINGSDLLNIAGSISDLAELLRMKGEYDRAENLFREALHIIKDDPTYGNLETAIILNNLALLLQNKGKLYEAEDLLRQALKIHENISGSEDPETANTLNNLSQVLYSEYRYEEAEHFCRRTLNIRKKVFGPEHPYTAQSLNNLAMVLYHENDYYGAEPLLNDALKINKNVLGFEHRETASNLNNLALVLNGKGKNEEAEINYRKALEIREKVLGPNHPDTAVTLYNLAMILHNNDDYYGAEPFYKRALEIYENVNPEHPDIIPILNSFAMLLCDKGDFAKAEPLLKKALHVAEMNFGSEHPSTNILRNNLESIQNR